jgi:hypothetical protein
MGPQKISRAIGISARLAAAAVKRLLKLVTQIGHGPKRHRLTANSRQLQIAQRIDRGAFGRGGACRDIDGIDAVADLGDRGAEQAEYSRGAKIDKFTGWARLVASFRPEALPVSLRSTCRGHGRRYRCGGRIVLPDQHA